MKTNSRENKNSNKSNAFDLSATSSVRSISALKLFALPVLLLVLALMILPTLMMSNLNNALATDASGTTSQGTTLTGADALVAANVASGTTTSGTVSGTAASSSSTTGTSATGTSGTTGGIGTQQGVIEKSTDSQEKLAAAKAETEALLKSSALITSSAASNLAQSPSNDTVSTTYVDANGNTQTVNAVVISAETTSITVGNWYVIQDSISSTTAITASGAGSINIILADSATGATINCASQATAAIDNSAGTGLNFYGQTQNKGSLTATGGSGCAGIGASSGNGSGSINIYGGKITATGGTGAPGIGAGSGGSNASITLNGGVVIATGGSGAPAIGGGQGATSSSIAINGGKITLSNTSGTPVIGGAGASEINVATTMYFLVNGTNYSGDISTKLAATDNNAEARPIPTLTATHDGETSDFPAYYEGGTADFTINAKNFLATSPSFTLTWYTDESGSTPSSQDPTGITNSITGTTLSITSDNTATSGDYYFKLSSTDTDGKIYKTDIVTFSVNKYELTLQNVAAIPDQPVGAEPEPVITQYDKATGLTTIRTLEKDTDFSVTYEGTGEPGTGTGKAIIKAKGNYKIKSGSQMIKTFNVIESTNKYTISLSTTTQPTWKWSDNGAVSVTYTNTGVSKTSSKTVNYRVKGEEEWSQFSKKGNPVALSNLSPATYEIYAVGDDDYADSDIAEITLTNKYSAKAVFCNEDGTAMTGVDAQELIPGEKLIAPTAPAVAGKVFDKWYEDAQCQTAFDFTNYTFNTSEVPASPTSDYQKSIYGKYNADPGTCWYIQFNSNGGSTVDAQNVVKGQKIVKPQDPEKAGYHLKYWASDEALQNEWDFDDAPTSAMTLYAKWEANSYKVQFESDGEQSYTQDMVYDTEAALDACTFTKEGYTFEYWTDSDGNHYADKATVKNLTEIKDFTVTLTAHWKANTYKVKFNSNGGTGTMSDEDFTYDVEKALTANAFTLTGKNFAGWATTAGGEAVYEDKESVKNLTSTSGATVNLFAVWETPATNTYTLKFDGNNSTGGTAVGDMEVECGESWRYSFPMCTYEKKGYKCLGWGDATEGQIAYEQGDDFPDEDLAAAGETRTFYAIWEPITYTIAFDGNGGTGSMSSKTATYNVSQVLPENSFAKAGTTFSGWSLTKGGEVKYADKGSVVNLTDTDGATVTLYAVWGGTITTYTVTFDTNGGTPSTITSQQVQSGKTATEPTETITKKGYTLDCWINKADQQPYDFSTPVTADLNLQVKWTPVKYTIKFDKNNESATGSMDSVEKTYGTSLTLPANAFTLTDHTFSGWSKTSQGSVQYADKAVLNEDLADTEGAEVTLYAVWQGWLPTYTVKFQNESSETLYPDATVEKGKTVAKPEDPTKTGYVFKGWYKNGGSEVYDFDTPVTEDFILVGKFEIQVFVIHFDSNGGTEFEDQIVAYNGTVTNPGSPTKTGYTFDTWHKEGEASSYNFNAKVTSSFTLKAYYNKVITYCAVTFDPMGGEVSGSTDPWIQSVEYGKACPKPANDPVKENYRFLGWYLEGSQTVFDFNSAITQDIRIIAKYEEYKKYTVTFSADGGTPVPDAQVVYEGQKASKPDTDPTKTDFEFLGWVAQGESQLFDFDNRTITANITIVASWKEVGQVSVTFDADGGTPTPAVQHFAPGGKATKPTPDPTKADYVFKGWCLSGSSQVFDFNTPVTEDITLIAKWESDVKYHVTFETLGGSTVGPLDVPEGWSLSDMSPTYVDPVLEGSTFLNWREDTEFYFDDDPIYDDHDFVACYKVNDTQNDLIITLNAEQENGTPETEKQVMDNAVNIATELNGEGSVTGITDEQAKEVRAIIKEAHEAKEDVVLSLSTEVQVHSLEQSEWNMFGPKALSNAYEDQHCYSINILMQIWKFEQSNGQVVSKNYYTTETETPISLVFNNANELPYTTGGIQVLRMHDDEVDDITDNGTVVREGTNAPVVTIVSDKFSVYDVAYGPQTVDFQTNGATEAIASQHPAYGELVTKPKDPVHELGYTFAGWYSDEALTQAYDFNTPVTQNLTTLYAKWTDAPTTTYTVTFDAEGGSPEPEAQTVKEGEKATRPAVDPTKAGYVFEGWFKDGKEYDFDSTVNSSFTLFAQWSEVKTYTVTFNADGGSPEPEAQIVKEGEKATRPAVDPTKAGNKFTGWFKDGKEYDFTSPVTENFSLVAQWEEAKTYEVTFDAAGGEPTPEVQYIAEGGFVQKPADDPTKDGYTFKGWFKGEETAAYDFDTPVTENFTLTAGWEEVVTPTPSPIIYIQEVLSTGTKTGDTWTALILASLSLVIVGGGVVIARRRMK